MGTEPSPELMSQLYVAAVNIEYHIERESVMFTKSWPVTEETFEYLRRQGKFGIRVWEMNNAANPRLVSHCCC